MQRITLTISTGNRSFTVQGTEKDVDALFNHLVSETMNLNGRANANPSPCTCGHHHDHDEHNEEPPHEQSAEPETTADEEDMPTTPVSDDVEPTTSAPAPEPKEEPVPPAPVSATTDGSEKKFPVRKPKEPEEGEEPAEPKKYKGFMLIKCEHCGKVKGFNTKYEMDDFKCMECGHITMLGDLIPITALCECGRRWRYMTNLTDDSFEMECLNCGSPIPIFYSDKKGKFETVLETLPDHGKKGKKTTKPKKK